MFLKKNEKNLVVISIPFQRIIRTHLSSIIIEPIIKNNAEILIVSPFSDNLDFINSFANKKISFYKFISSWESLKSGWLILYVLRIMRTNSYYKRNQNVMNYYIKNRHIKFGENGKDRELNWYFRWLIDILGHCGKYSYFLKLLNRLISTFDINHINLLHLTKEYDQVTIIQASSWGEQDRILALISEKLRWRKVFLPYTTDQLLCNGYLYTDYHGICVKGPLEEKYAIEFHSYPKSKLFRTGSVQFRVLDLEINKFNLRKQKMIRKSLIYAGTTAIVFPRKSELAGLSAILMARKAGLLGDIDVVYRGFFTKEEVAELNRINQNEKNFYIQPVPARLTGLNVYDGEINRDVSEEYIRNLLGCKLLVTVVATSLSLDAAYLGVPTVMYWGDDTGVMSKRHTRELFDKNSRLRELYTEIPTSFSTVELVENIVDIIFEEKKAKEIIEKTIKSWDYSNINFQNAFRSAVFG